MTQGHIHGHGDGFFTVTSLEGFLQIACVLLLQAFRRNYQGNCSTGGRDLPIYAAGWTGAMTVKFLVQGNNSDSITDTTTAWDLVTTRPMLQPHNCSYCLSS